MSERIERLLGGGAADPHHPPPQDGARPPAVRRRRPTEPELRLTPDDAIARLRAAARDAAQDVQFSLETVDEQAMVVTRRADGTLVRSTPLAEALRLAASLCGGAGGLYQGSL